MKVPAAELQIDDELLVKGEFLPVEACVPFEGRMRVSLERGPAQFLEPHQIVTIRR
jgi:hypothetical protein